MKKVSLLAVLALAACASGSDEAGNPLGTQRAGVANTGVMFSVMKDGETKLDSRMDDMFLTQGPGDNGTQVSFGFSTVASKKNPQTYLILTTTDMYADDSEFTRSRTINQNLFQRALNGRAIIADYSDIYTAFYYTNQDAPVDVKDANLTLDYTERRIDEFQVALGGGALGLEFSDFGYWRAQYYTRESGARGVPQLMSYDWQPIFGGKDTNLLGTTIADAGRSGTGTFTGNAVALITYEKGSGGEVDTYYDTPVGGLASFDLASQTLTIEFDRWYTMTFVDNTSGGGATAADNATVSIAKGAAFADKFFKLGNNTVSLSFANLGNAVGTGTLAYEFYGSTPAASEMVGGFSYWQGAISDPNGSLGIVGGFGAKWGDALGRNDGQRHDARPGSSR